jgi:hypothetical protein
MYCDGYVSEASTLHTAYGYQIPCPDNNACFAVAMSQNPTPRAQHMDIKYHTLYEWVKHNLLKLEQMDTMVNLVDQFTKRLGLVLFFCFVDYIFGKVPPTYSSAFVRFSK